MNRLKLEKMVHIPESDPVILYKKLHFNMKSPYQLFKYVIGKTYFVEKFNEDVHKNCTRNRIYSVPKNELIKWAGVRYFKVHVWGKCILEKNNKIGSEYLKIIRELKPKEFVEYMTSSEACFYCQLVKDIKEVRDKINDSYNAYCYCKSVKDRKKVRDKIVVSEWACIYCTNIKNRKEVRDRITEKVWKHFLDEHNAEKIKKDAQNKKNK